MMAFEQLEPFGGLADDFRAGQIAAVYANTKRDTKRRPEPFTAPDFMPALAAARRRRPEAKPFMAVTKEEQSAVLDRVLFGGGPR